ncbi:isoleucine--tRNA ligase [Acidicapsa dinghuensis]|uniref:Isoleucine--tRNA ligase n=1 Tax=Acidicapsa dinghuensis TaxID=2218256 RepID=A0ABW1EH36_9BACT|nr:isoleucine--tRNA ligase [Acidicapsa dinghuensis]
MPAVPELKATLTLPKTDFPMKANLPQNEPTRLQRWAEMDIYARLRETSKGRPSYILHDGPPYANGPIHLGHALNKGLKDFVVKSKTMAGFDSPYIPGFDCHGLPIEIKVDEQLGRKKLEMPAPAVLEACRAYAQKYIDLQTKQFVRLGVFGRWDDPYKTMSRDYEARTLETFYGFFEKGFVYRGLKPVYWCIHDRTALADAEIEYEQHTSPSVYVRYKLTSDVKALGEEAAANLSGRDVYVIIWTTTPWTLPASLAVAFHPNFEYVAFTSGQESHAPAYIVAAPLAASVATACHLSEPTVLARFPGDRLDRATFQHPFLDRSILGVNAEYVTADQGTGAVHTAPSHGADDFYTGVRYGLDPTTRVDNAGVIHVDTSAWHEPQPPAFDGKRVFQANPLIIELLKERGALLGSEKIEHSYPHCWRCHNPVIFRATEQWFIGIDIPVLRADGSETTFRQLTIEEIAKVKWDPAWGQERITNMIATRPDWCISRQRIWGVPIAVFLCQKCNAPIEDAALNKQVVELFETRGAEAWHTTSVEDLLPTGTACKKCHASGPVGEVFRKETDILDVWFDSGSSWHAVAETDRDLRDEYNKPDRKVLYLEGGDQHRGWFHSSLLASVALRGRAPYSHVATAGWTLDELGRAMSKSLGNGVDPVEVAEKMGGEIIRLWVASVDFREDMAASDNLMKRCAEIYRKLRNTFRFLLGNLSGFDPVAHQVATADLEPLDRYMLARTRELTEQVLRWYEAFEFHRIYHAVNEFCIADLSAFYLDVLKDRMYTFAPSSRERRSAQTVLWKITEALVRLVAPILSFTADEVWDYLPKVEGREASVHLALFPKPEEIYADDPAPILAEWKHIFAVRDAVLLVLEEARQEKHIGKGLEADIEIGAEGELLALLRKYEGGLKEVFNVSAVRILDGVELRVIALPAAGHKCARCWNFMPEVANYGAWADVCTRCHNALKAMGIEPPTEADEAGA